VLRTPRGSARPPRSGPETWVGWRIAAADHVTFNGWVDQSLALNPYSPSDRFNGPLTWTDRSNDWQLNEFRLGSGRKTDGGAGRLDLGYRVDVIYGTNYRWDTSSGFESGWGTNVAFCGIAVPNCYGEASLGDWTVRVGRFISPVGFYAVGSPNNFLPFVPYTFQYGEPFTHTGVWVRRFVNDALTVGMGAIRGWNNSDNTGNPGAGLLAEATWTFAEEDTLAWVAVFSNEPNESGMNPYSQTGLGSTPRYLQTLVYTRHWSAYVLTAVQSDFGSQPQALIDGGLAQWYGINTYTYWNLRSRLQWGINLEWFRDQGGFAVGQVLPSLGSPRGRGWSPPGAGFDGSFMRAAVGPRWRWTDAVTVRAAFVADWYAGPRGSAGGFPFDDGQRTSQQLLVLDLVNAF
jgi:hypothetical protein